MNTTIAIVAVATSLLAAISSAWTARSPYRRLRSALQLLPLVNVEEMNAETRKRWNTHTAELTEAAISRAEFWGRKPQALRTAFGGLVTSAGVTFLLLAVVTPYPDVAVRVMGSFLFIYLSGFGIYVMAQPGTRTLSERQYRRRRQVATTQRLDAQRVNESSWWKRRLAGGAVSSTAIWRGRAHQAEAALREYLEEHPEYELPNDYH